MGASRLLETLVKLASLGTSGICIFAIFWIGWLVKKPTSLSHYRTLRFYMIACIIIAVISAASGILNAYFNAAKIEKIQEQLPTAIAHGQACKWVQSGGESCVTACQSEGSKPVISGQYTNQNPFYVCRTNANNEGFRAGYNLQPAWSHACIVGWGGQESSYNSYECLCQ
jgi:hypothetical protein